jgi:hypothetical protein
VSGCEAFGIVSVYFKCFHSHSKMWQTNIFVAEFQLHCKYVKKKTHTKLKIALMELTKSSKKMKFKKIQHWTWKHFSLACNIFYKKYFSFSMKCVAIVFKQFSFFNLVSHMFYCDMELVFVIFSFDCIKNIFFFQHTFFFTLKSKFFLGNNFGCSFICVKKWLKIKILFNWFYESWLNRFANIDIASRHNKILSNKLNNSTPFPLHFIMLQKCIRSEFHLLEINIYIYFCN